VVDVAAAVELQGRLQRDHGRDVVARLGGCVLFGARVEVGDVGLVVLGVVELHDLRRDHGLEGAVILLLMLLLLLLLLLLSGFFRRF
jgi:hypothetical protein